LILFIILLNFNPNNPIKLAKLKLIYLTINLIQFLNRLEYLRKPYNKNKIRKIINLIQITQFNKI